MNKKKTAMLLVMLTLLLTLFTFPASAAKISQKKATLVVGQTLKLKIKKASGVTKWSSTQKAVASVNKKGVVTARKKGTATIKAKVNGKTFKCKVTVKANLYTSKDDSCAAPTLDWNTVKVKVSRIQYTAPDTMVVTIMFRPLNDGIIVRSFSLSMFNHGSAFLDERVILTNPFSVGQGNTHTLSLTLTKKDSPSMRFIDLNKLTDAKFSYVVGF